MTKTATTARAAANSRFQVGKGAFDCESCGRKTRGATGTNVKTCNECYELAGFDNMLSDYGPDAFKRGDWAEVARMADRLVELGAYTREAVVNEFECVAHLFGMASAEMIEAASVAAPAAKPAGRAPRQLNYHYRADAQISLYSGGKVQFIGGDEDCAAYVKGWYGDHPVKLGRPTFAKGAGTVASGKKAKAAKKA